MASPAAGAEWTAVLTLPKFTKNTRHNKKAQTARHGTERGCEVGLNASGEKYMDFMLSNIVHTFIFSAELRLLLRRHMELHECTAQEAGSVASPGLALDQFYPVSLWHHPSVLWGSPSEASGIWVWFSWGRGAPPRTAGLRPQPRWGSFGGTKRVAEGSCPDG